MHVFQVGAGSGGIVVLDLIARNPFVTSITLIEPDVYAAHNVYRHVFPSAAIGRMKAELAAEWVAERCPDIAFEPIIGDITDPTRNMEYARLAHGCDIGICAVDNEPAKFAFDALMRSAGKPWTLGEVLSGGIGGWTHRFVPGGPCYGCVTSYLQRTGTDQPAAPPADYSDPTGRLPEATIPASKASIELIASLHATLTLERLEDLGTSKKEDVRPNQANDFTSLLFTLKSVPQVFEEAFRSFRFRVPRAPGCLVCSAVADSATGENLDVAMDQALARLGPQ